VTEAIVQTYRTAGKTVFFSGIAVMIGFAAIGLSTFKLYQSAAAVAIGVAALMLALVTIVPFFMAVLGKTIFWPSKGQLEHKESRFWGAVGTFALSRPLIALLIVAAVTVPFLAFYDGDLSYNSLNEAGENVPSTKAFNMIADAFGPGQSMPTQIVIKNDEPMNTAEYLGLAEKISQEIEKNDKVDFVRSVTRPMGQPIKDLFVAKQAKDLGEGVGKGNDGIKEISDGLKTAGSKLSKSEPQLKQATDGIGGLISGTDELKSGIGQVSTGLSRIENGIRDGSMGSGEIKKGLLEVKKNLTDMSAGSKKLLAGYQQAVGGLAQLEGGYKKIQGNLTDLAQAFRGTDQSLARIQAKYPGISKDADFQRIKGTVGAAQQGLPQMAGGMAELNKNLSNIQGGLAVANKNFAPLPSGQRDIANGLGQLIAGVEKLQTGLTAAANGQEQIIGHMSKFEGGLSSINNGQQELLNGFSELGGQMNQLTDGLDKSANGLNEVHKGLNSAQDYLSGLASSNQEMSGLYIPKEVLSSKDFKQSLDAYMPKNHKVMTMDVVFKENPYSNDAISQIDNMKDAVANSVKGTKLENANIAVGGVTSTYHDLGAMSAADYSRTVVLMLSGIAIILFIMLRSFVMPIYLIASLILTYYTASAITEVIFVNIFGLDGISWAVPFFAFVILIALGIDYSIFLMDRFNEYKDKPIKEAMLLSMRKMGTVIISAAIILGGTFAAMMPAGVLSLLQIATLILIGLVLYALVILPLFIPVMAKIFGKANWWPFIK
jgi:putative drug exporter of the RND superfamily